METATDGETKGTGQDRSEKGSRAVSGRRTRTKTNGAVEGKLSHVLKDLFGCLEVQILEKKGKNWGE
jgi:hypothetical protein